MAREFSSSRKFYWLLDGEFMTEADREGRKHTLAQFAALTCEKGVAIATDHMVHYFPRGVAPTWYADLHQPSDRRHFNAQLKVAPAYVGYPEPIRFTHIQTNPAMSPHKDFLSIVSEDSNISEVHELQRCKDLLIARRRVSEAAQDFFSHLKTD